MATDNVVANAGVGGDTFRTLAEVGGVEWPASVLGYPTTVAAGANVVQLVDATHGLPVAVVGTPAVTAVVTNAGTFAVQAAQSGPWDVGTVTALTGITNPVAVTDNSGSLTVDAPVASPVFVRLSDGASAISTLPVSLASVPSHAVTNAGTFAVQAAQSGNWPVRNQDGAGNALTSAARGSERALSVQVVDASGAQVTSFGGGGGTQYAEGATAATITGTAVMWEDAGDTLRAVSAAKPLPVNIVSGAGSGGTASTDDAAFTAASGSGTPMMGFATTDQVDSGDVGVLAMNVRRQLKVTVHDGSGNEVVAGPVSAWSHLRKDVTTTAAALGASTPASVGVTVKAGDGNTAALYIGSGSGVTAGGTAATDGYEMNAGDVAFFPVNNLNLLFGISASGTQKAFVTVH
jgi:hypothetical protein